MANKAYYRQLLVDRRLKLTRERDAKKRDNESYTRMIKNSQSASAKAALRRSKIQKSDDHNRRIESLRVEIARIRLDMARASK